ncbi:MAG: MoxR family ATPase [Flavobacteriales bacterium]|nr:MoxR family ATPase [Flavobacteriales bacterium]
MSNSENPFENRLNLSGLKESVDRIREEIAKIIVGQHEVVDMLILAILSDGHVLLEGVPGVAKTLVAKLTARTLSVDFSRVQFTPDLMPSDIIGTSIFNVKTQEFEFKKGPVFAHIVLCDEINRAPAKTQAALFECMQEKQITMDGVTYPLAPPFLVLATQNPIEQEGTYRLPEAQLDRFLFKVSVDYPSLEEEVKIIREFHRLKGNFSPVQIQPVLSVEQIEHYRSLVADVHVEDHLMEYIAHIIQQTRNNRNLMLGASPRASLAILSGAKAKAAISGRDFITPDDIKYVAKPVLRHRIQLTPESEMEGMTADRVVSDILELIEVPR